MKPIAVLGAGPAGLLAAHAIGMLGKPVAIFSLKNKSEIPAGDFLTRAIPGIHNAKSPDDIVQVVIDGDVDARNKYADKLYGVPLHNSDDRFHTFITGRAATEGVAAWDLHSTYDKLWNFFQSNINDEFVDASWVEKRRVDFDAVVSTIPLTQMCKTLYEPTPITHVFNTRAVQWVPKMLQPIAENTIVFDGTADKSWASCANVFGHQATEWGEDVQPPMPNLQLRPLPVNTTCDCWPDVVTAGSFGTWQAGGEPHDVVTQVVRGLEARS